MTNNDNINPNQLPVPPVVPIVPVVPPVVPDLTYTKTYESLRPLTSNQAEEYVAEDVRVGEPIRDEHLVAASNQHFFCNGYHKSNRTTSEEVMESKKRKTSLLLESIGMVPFGREWAQEFTNRMAANHQILLQELQANRAHMDQRFLDMDQRLTDMDQRLTDMDQRVTESLTEIQNNVTKVSNLLKEVSVQSSRSTNRNLEADENIAPVPHDNGLFPEHDFFPRHPADIKAMNEDNVDELLRFYSALPGRRATLNDKKRLLCEKLDLKYLVKFFSN